jgi:molybdopterin-guanine dinucleotide biosynthesis protein B
MKVVGFCGYSGSGKTTLVEQLVSRLRLAGERVSVVKHAHHDFDIDHPGKDSHRHREAGAFEVVIASDRRLAKIREYEVHATPTPHQVIAELCDCDWVLVEGFKQADLLKIEVWRASTGQPVQYPHDPFVVAIATDSPQALPRPTALPLLDLNDADTIVAFLRGQAARHEYHPPHDFEPEASPAPAEPARRDRAPARGDAGPD